MTLNRSYISIILIIIFFSCNIKSKQKDIKTKLHQNSIKLLLDFPYDTLVNEIIQHTAYTLAYSEEYEQASWVQYKLYKTNLELPKVERKDKFKEDIKIFTGSARKYI